MRHLNAEQIPTADFRGPPRGGRDRYDDRRGYGGGGSRRYDDYRSYGRYDSYDRRGGDAGGREYGRGYGGRDYGREYSGRDYGRRGGGGGSSGEYRDDYDRRDIDQYASGGRGDRYSRGEDRREERADDRRGYYDRDANPPSYEQAPPRESRDAYGGRAYEGRGEERYGGR